MTLEKILNTIAEYEALKELVEHTVTSLQKFSNDYNTAKGIEQIWFDEKEVAIVCDDSCCGSYSTHTVEFPLEWLTKTEEELKEIIGDKKQKEEQLRKQKEEERQRKEKEEEEKKQRELYMRLKAKFEP